MAPLTGLTLQQRNTAGLRNKKRVQVPVMSSSCRRVKSLNCPQYLISLLSLMSIYGSSVLPQESHPYSQILNIEDENNLDLSGTFSASLPRMNKPFFITASISSQDFCFYLYYLWRTFIILKVFGQRYHFFSFDSHYSRDVESQHCDEAQTGSPPHTTSALLYISGLPQGD